MLADDVLFYDDALYILSIKALFYISLRGYGSFKLMNKKIFPLKPISFVFALKEKMYVFGVALNSFIIEFTLEMNYSD